MTEYESLAHLVDEENISELELSSVVDSEAMLELAPEPLFAAMLRRAVTKIWPGDPVMADWVDHVAQPLSDLLGHRSAKGGDFAMDMAAQGKDAVRYSFDQSMRAHLVNGLLPVLHVASKLKAWGAPQFRYYDDEVRRLFMAGYILHDWLKLPEVETELEAAGFSHAASIGPAQMPLVEAILARWCDRLGLAAFLAPLGGPASVMHDLIFIAANTQIKWGTLRNLSLLPRLTLNGPKLNLCEQLSRLADYLTYIARNPREAAANPSIRRELSALSNQMAYLSYHHLADNRGILTNFIHNSALQALQHEARTPLLYAPSGVVYLTRKDAPPPPALTNLIEATIERIKRQVGTRLRHSLDGFKRDGKGMKYADYYWLFFDLPSFINLGPGAVFKVINPAKKPSAGKRFTKMLESAWLPDTVDLDLPDDLRVDQLAEWCYLAEKMVAAQHKTFDTAGFLLTEMELADLKADFMAVPRDNRAGGVGYHWYFAAGHYLKRHPGLDPVAWQKRIEALANKLAAALPSTEPAITAGDADWPDLRNYIAQVLTIGPAAPPAANGKEPQAEVFRQTFVTELHRYQNAKRKGRGTTSICSLCSSAYEISKQQEAAILFAPQVYSNKLPLHGADALRNICSICGLEIMLRQLLMNRSNASGGDFEGWRVRYLYFYPTYFFTPETLELFRQIYLTLRRLSFTELRKQLLTGQGHETTVNLEPTTLQRLEPLLLTPAAEYDPAADRYIRMHFSEQEPAPFYFLGVPPPGREAKEAEAWVHPAFLSLLLPLCVDVKVVASESSLPLLVEADELPEMVFLDAPHAFVRYLTQKPDSTTFQNLPGLSELAEQSRFNIDQILPTLQRLMVAYLIQMDANSTMGRTGFDYRWQDLPAVARNLATSPLYAFYYLKKWQRQQGLDNLPTGKAHLYLTYVEKYLAERSLPMSHARELTTLYRQFYRARRHNSNSILRPLKIAADTLLSADSRLFNDQQALIELVYGELRRRVTKLQEDGLAFYPKGSKWEDRETAMRRFADYLVNTVYFGALKGDPSALRGKQLNLLSSACEAIYRDEAARDWAEREEVESTEA